MGSPLRFLNKIALLKLASMLTVNSTVGDSYFGAMVIGGKVKIKMGRCMARELI